MQNLPDNGTDLLMLLPVISKTVVSAIDLKELGCTKTQLYIILALARNDNLTMSQIACHISASKEQATRSVAPLVENGLVERHTDPENRTKIHIHLTEKGHQFFEHSKKLFTKRFRAHIKSSISDEEYQELEAAVETIIRILGKNE